ncbi:MAG: DUF1559 domain-containing protein [Planctomycetaceae bacterium]
MTSGVIALTYCYQQAREGARWGQCRANLKQIGLALHIYRDVNGTFPPAYITNEDGKPMHSWRVLILPYFGDSRIYDRYDFSEPWDSPHNRELAQSPDARLFSRIFRCPSETESEHSTITHFVAVVGENTFWPGSDVREMSDDDIKKYADQMMVVEMAGSDIHWMEPRDLTLEQAVNGFNHPGRGVSSRHAQKIDYLSLGGRSLGLSKEIDRKTLVELLEF